MPFHSVEPEQFISNPSESDLEGNICEYTVYKSKIEFNKLRKEIKNNQLIVMLANAFILVLFGFIELIIVIISTILTNAPSLVLICLKFHIDLVGGSHIVLNKVATQCNILGIIKSFSLIFWFFVSHYYIN